jgi:DNA-binding NarL/FixJ family response regulator
LTHVVILDNQSVAESLAIALRAVDGVDDAVWVDSVSALSSILSRDRPDVLIVDIGGDNANERLELLKLEHVRSQQVRVLFLSRHDRGALLAAVRRRGASGFLLKDTPLQSLAAAVGVIARGGTVFDERIRPAPPVQARLPSQRELQLLGALAQGLTNAGIARELEISPRTVESHLRRLFSRYAVSSRSQLLMLALTEGWIAAGGPDGPSADRKSVTSCA